VRASPVFVGIASEWLYHLPEPQVWLLGALLVVVVLIAVDNNTDILFIVVLAAVTWAGLPRAVPPDDLVQPDPSRPVMVAVGDSFVSGEGAQRYYEGTNRRLDNECRRVPTAYPVLLADAAAAARSQAGPSATQLAQLRTEVDEDDLDVDLVLVTVGGNDAGFGIIARACFSPGPCEELAVRWITLLADLEPTLQATYEAIAEVVPDARVVAGWVAVELIAWWRVRVGTDWAGASSYLT
jgi:hypothetical protein